MQDFIGMLAIFLASVGAINWGFFIFLKLDLVDFLLVPGKNRLIKLAVYLIVTLSGLYCLLNLFWR